MMLAGWLELNGVEIVNVHRLLTYLRFGLAGPNWDVCVSATAEDEGTGYVDTYEDIYEGDPGSVSDLCCHCWAMPAGPYQDPAYDNAPWYDATRPESAEFFGLWPEIRLVPAAKRSVTQRVQGRADIGRLVVGARIVQVEGLMVASSPAGMAWGERWLNAVLAGGSGGCSGDVLRILPACPPEGGEAADAYRELNRVGLVDGPLLAPVDSKAPEAYVSKMSFQLAAGEPWLRQVSSLASFSLGGPDVCTTMTAPKFADAAAIITVHSGSSVLDGVVIDGYPGACYPPGYATTQLVVNDMPANHHLTIDASTETVTLRDVTGLNVGGLAVVDWTGVFRWIKAAAGSAMAIWIDATGGTGTADASVEIQQVNLEL